MLGGRCRALHSATRPLPRFRPSSSAVAAAASPSSHTSALTAPPRSLAVPPSVRAFSSAFPSSRGPPFASKPSQPFFFSTPSSTSLLRFALSPQLQSQSQSGSTQTRTFSASASLAGRRNTYNPSRRVQKRRHGFLARLRSRSGRKILTRRRAKGKRNLSW